MSATDTTGSLGSGPTEQPAAARPALWAPPLLWRALLTLARLVVPLVCRLRVTGDVPAGARRGPLLLAGNHIGTFDPIALTAACAVRGIAPRIMTTGGIFRAPVVGTVFRRCGHIRVERRHSSAAHALSYAIDALREGSVVAGYPEGRITLDPGLWPERGKTGLARVALATGVDVVPVVQWGAHEILAWDTPRLMLRSALRSIVRRPVVRVHFAPPVDLGGLRADVPGDAQRAADRITAATIEALRPLRADEPDLPRYVDPTRPVTTVRSYLHRRAAG